MTISDKVKNLVFVVDGGIGKNIAATAVVREIKKKYPDKKLLVLGGSSEIFFYNNAIRKVFNFNNPLYFYDDYVNDETAFLKVEPYLDYGYINKESHVVESWCKMLDLECESNKPDFFFLDNELEAAKLYVDKITNNGKKELVLLQWIGGKVPNDKSKGELQNSKAAMFRRSLPNNTVNELVDGLVERGYIVGVVGHENFPDVPNTTKIFFPIRSTIALLPYCKTFIGIDSFLQHAAAATQINKKGIVCWGGTSPKCLGYDTHINLTKSVCPIPCCHRPNSFLFDVQSHGAMWDCTYGEKCLKYTSKEILDVFDNNFGRSVPSTEVQTDTTTKSCDTCKV